MLLKILFLNLLLLISSPAAAHSDFINFDHLDSESTCRLQLEYFLRALKDREIWAFRFFDYSAKPPAGIILTTTRHFGIFDDCVNFKHHIDEAIGTIKGQYCRLYYRAKWFKDFEKDNSKFSLKDIGYVFKQFNTEVETGICVPESCSSDDTKLIAEHFFEKFDIEVPWVKCQKKKEKRLTSYDCFVFLFFAVLASIIAASTLYDTKLRNPQVTGTNLFTAFSISANTKELLKIDEIPSTRNITCIYGLRVIAAICVIMFHRTHRSFAYANTFMSRPADYQTILIDYIFSMNRNAVNIFLLISAILMTRSCMAAFDKKSLNLKRIYFLRYMRYAPCLAVLLLFFTSIIPYLLVSGPLEFGLDDNVAICRKYWWASILMIQTYINVDDMCLSHTWYLSSDFQLCVISPFLIYFLWKYKNKAAYCFVVAVVAAQLAALYNSFYKSTTHNIFFLTHYRLGQWLVGLIFGYVSYSLNKASLELPKKIVKLLWILSSCSSAYMYYGIAAYQYESFESKWFESFRDILYTFMIGCIIMLCHHSTAINPFNWILSLSVWQPMAKLTMCMYLVHDIYIIMSISNLQQAPYFTSGWLIHILIGDVVVTIFLGYVLYVCIEAPVTNIIGYYLKRKDEKFMK